MLVPLVGRYRPETEFEWTNKQLVPTQWVPQKSFLNLLAHLRLFQYLGDLEVLGVLGILGVLGDLGVAGVLGF